MNAEHDRHRVSRGKRQRKLARKQEHIAATGYAIAPVGLIIPPPLQPPDSPPARGEGFPENERFDDEVARDTELVSGQCVVPIPRRQDGTVYGEAKPSFPVVVSLTPQTSGLPCDKMRANELIAPGAALRRYFSLVEDSDEVVPTIPTSLNAPPLLSELLTKSASQPDLRVRTPSLLIPCDSTDDLLDLIT